MKKLIFISILFFLSIYLFADDCGQPLDCPAGVKYPYIFCTPKQEIICTDDPIKFEADHPDIIAQRIALPIWIHFYGYSYGHRYFSKYNNIELFSNVIIPETPYRISTKELFGACDKWNCVCGYPSGSLDGAGIFVIFSDDAKDFRDAKNTLASSVVKVRPDADGNGCYVDPSKSIIYFNSTPDFLYGKKDFPSDVNTPFIRGWVNQVFLENLKLVPNSPDVKIYSFLEVAMHEIGHLLGFGHYDTIYKGAPGPSAYCDNDVKVYGIMNRSTNDIRTGNITELSQYDKCMMAKLYCPDLVNVGIAEELPARPNISVSPNPATGELNIRFDVLDDVKSVTMRLCNEQGQILYTLMSEVMYSAGTHAYNVKLNLPTGVYFILTTINKTMYSEKIIAK